MQVKIIEEEGIRAALFGLGLSHGLTSDLRYDNFQRNELGERMISIANKLAGKGNGHDKFLRQICVWLDITAPRYWWPEMDQYKVATVTQSESTMHTITKKEFVLEDFEFDSLNNTQNIIWLLNSLREQYINTKDKNIWRQLIQLLPQSYLQRRILTCNYATLRNIIDQRTGHRLSEWQVFIDAIRSQCKHPELLS